VWFTALRDQAIIIFLFEEDLAGGYWLWEGPEYLITIHVAENIAKLSGSKYITLEHSSAQTVEDAGAKGRGCLPRDIREHGKVDILVWWANDTPRAIIEIKNQIYSKEQYIKDIKRIKEFINRNTILSTIQFGIFAFYDSAYDGKRKSAKDKIQSKLKKIEKSVKEIVGINFRVELKTFKIHQIEENAWIAACVLIRKMKT
jgi:hypothetical protein